MRNFIDVAAANKTVALDAMLNHLILSFTAVGIGTLISVPLGILLTRYRKAGKKVLAFMSVLQTIPSMVLFGFFIPIIGIGRNTALFVLVIYSIVPVLRNTYTGVSEVPSSYLEAAAGMGMNGFQRLIQIELPIALPVIVAGIRLSSVYIISWATVASLIGAGGLGDLIYTGIITYNYSLILLAAILSSTLAVIISFLIGQIAKWVTPKGLRN